MAIYDDWEKAGWSLWRRDALSRSRSRVRKAVRRAAVQRAWEVVKFWAAVLGLGVVCVAIGAILGAL